MFEGEIKVGVCEVSTVLEVTEDVMCDSIVVSRMAAICRLQIIEDCGVEERLNAVPV